jgi:hypothetical protein
MRTELRTWGIVVLATLLLAGCGDNDNTVFLDNNDNTNTRTATPIARTPTPASTPERTATEVAATETAAPEATETAAPEATETPAPEATETAVGPTATPAGPTITVTPSGQSTGSPTPGPTATPFCGNSVKDTGEQCDTGGVFSTDASCAAGEQCACCLCRPDAVHAPFTMSKCSGCHPANGFTITIPPGAAETFLNVCE